MTGMTSIMLSKADVAPLPAEGAQKREESTRRARFFPDILARVAQANWKRRG